MLNWACHARDGQLCDGRKRCYLWYWAYWSRHRTFFEVWPIQVAIAAFMILVARPIAVYTSVLPFKFKKIERSAFISWVGLRGAVPITLSMLPVIAGVDNAFMLFDIALGVVVWQVGVTRDDHSFYGQSV